MKTDPTSRANPVIWRLAEYCFLVFESRKGPNWYDIHQEYRNRAYDAAKKLQYKLVNNEFTGEDNHKD